jgi:hypothetical protein
MRRRPWGFCVVALLVACRPEVPGRDCKAPADCFREEVCASGTCIARVEAAPTGGAPTAGGDSGPGGADGAAPTGGSTDAEPSRPDGAVVDAMTAETDAAWDAAASDLGP